MKQILLFLSILIISCQNPTATEKEISTTPEEEAVQKEENLLNGTWAENREENALFLIKGDFLYYTEDQETPVPIEFNEKDLIIKGSATVHCKILKLTNDSLWFIDEFSDDTTKLIKIK